MTNEEALATARKAFADNSEALETALAGDTSGWIYWYRQYELGLKINGDKCQACRVDMATVNPPRLSNGKSWVNGVGVRAETVARVYALKVALSKARKVQVDFEVNLAKHFQQEG